MKQCTSVHAYYGRCELEPGHESGDLVYHKGRAEITTDLGFPGEIIRHWGDDDRLAERVAS